MRQIIEIVAEHFNIPVSDILSTKKTKEIAYTRQICMYLCKQLTEETYLGIGKALNKRIVLLLCMVLKIQEDINYNPSTKNLIDVLTKKIDPS